MIQLRVSPERNLRGEKLQGKTCLAADRDKLYLTMRKGQTTKGQYLVVRFDVHLTFT